MIRVGAGLLALVAASTRDAGAADIAEGKAAFVRHRACRTPATSSTSAPDRTRRIRHLRKSTRCRCRDTEFAAWTSIATVWFGCRSTADISRASTAENAQARSTGQAPSAVRSAPKDGRSTRFPGQALPAIRVPRKVRIISGSTSTTSSGSAPIRRLPPATSRIRCTHWLAAASSNCAFPIRWVSMPRTSMAGSTIRAPAGREGRCG